MMSGTLDKIRLFSNFCSFGFCYFIVLCCAVLYSTNINIIGHVVSLFRSGVLNKYLGNQ